MLVHFGLLTFMRVSSVVCVVLLLSHRLSRHVPACGRSYTISSSASWRELVTGGGNLGIDYSELNLLFFNF